MDSGPPLLACPWHGWEYDIATGQSFMGPGRGNVPALSYDVSVLPGSELAEAKASKVSRAGPDGRVPGPYVAETVPVSVEQDYVVVEDSPARRGLGRARDQGNRDQGDKDQEDKEALA
jgi:nitrite reductase/ring-hydroxylating ferredoxin subunit